MMKETAKLMTDNWGNARIKFTCRNESSPVFVGMLYTPQSAFNTIKSD